MSSDSEVVDNPQSPGVKRVLFRKRKLTKESEIRELLETEFSDEDDNFDYDSDSDPEFQIRKGASPQSSDSESINININIPVPSTSVELDDSAFVTPRGGQPVGSHCVSGGSSGGSGQRRPLSTPKVGRKRIRNPDNWMQTIAKKNRQQGKEYVSVKTKKTVAARQPGPLCKDRCLLKVPDECRQEIFKKCWEIGSYDARLNYYNSCVSERPFKRKYTTKATSIRPAEVVYSVKSKDKRYEICRSGFQSIHGMTSKEMQVFLRKRKDSPTGAIPADRRGRHEPQGKIKGVQLERVHEHIKLLSVTTSHYSRIKNPHRQYTTVEGLTVQKLFTAYVMWMTENYPTEKKVKQKFYHHIFTTNYNIAFKQPQTDVCNECTSLQQAIKDGHDDDALAILQDRLTLHRDTAKAAQLLLKEQKDVVDDDLMVICVDLQQTLPCPKLSCNRAYYTRKVWLYNLCIYDVIGKKPTLYMWEETQGGRGADDIASCIHRWLEDNANGRKKLRIFADNCAAQNKNKTIVLMALQKVHQKMLDRVEFIYLVSGHSFLPCDRVFGVIEKRLKQYSEITSPVGYVSVVEESGASGHDPQAIKKMEIDDFLAFSALDKYCHWKTPAATFKGSFQKARQIIVTKDYPCGYIIKLHYNLEDTDTNLVKVSLSLEGRKGKGGRGKGRGRGRQPGSSVLDFNLATVALQRRYPGRGIQLNEQKLKDLELLLPYMGEMGRNWVNKVMEQQQTLQSQSPAGEQGPQQHPEDLDPDDLVMDFEEVRRNSS